MGTKISPDAIYLKATDKFIKFIQEYLKENGLTMEEFCEKNDLPFYMTNKVFDTSIRMSVDVVLFRRVARLLGVPRGTILAQEQTCKKGGDFALRKQTVWHGGE